MADEQGQTAAETGSAGQDERPRRIFTLRALVLGLGLTLVLGWIVPWNDFTLGNTLLYNNFMPPAVSLVLLCFGLAINPLLGRHRLHRGEMVVITVMLLGLGGVVSSGLNRYLPTVIGSSARVLATTPALESLREDLPPERVAELRASFEQRVAQDLASRDRNGDGVLQPAEYPGGESGFQHADSDGDGTLDAAELAAQIEARDPNVVADWRWPLARELYIALPEAGQVESGDPEYEYVVSGYLNGLGSDDELLRVDHRRVVSWQRLPGGEPQVGQLALAGDVADAHRRRGEPFLDLDDPDLGGRMVGLRPGEAVAVGSHARHQVAAGDTWESIAAATYGADGLGGLLARANAARGEGPPAAGTTIELPEILLVRSIEPPGVPWYAWWDKLAAWAPLLLGAFAAMVALAGIVRKQWIDNERLPYPIAQVTLAFMDEPDGRSRFGAIFRNAGFWIGLAVAGGVITWNGLAAYGLVPIEINTVLQLSGEGKPFNGHPWNLVLSNWQLFNLKIWFSIIALCFFLSLELSFSLWFFFVASQFLTMFLRMGGVPVEGRTVAEASTGGFITMCALILWVGRHYYWRVLKAALFIDRSDPAVRQAAPYVWILLVSCAAMVGFFTVQGTPVVQSVFAVLLFLGFLLVLARIVAEAGVPFLQLPSAGGLWFGPNLFTAIGFSLPAPLLLPLAAIGITLMADPREALLPYAVNADYMGDQTKARPLGISSLVFTGAAVGCVVAFASMVYFAYTSDGAANDGWATRLLERDGFQLVADGTAAQASTESAATQAQERAGSLTAYGVGAGVVGILGCARFVFASWPLHPLGFLTMATYPTGQIWFSFFLAWLLKAMVMRYGGSGMYRRLKPVAIGLIAGEALAAGGFMLVKIAAHQLFDVTLDSYRALPG